MNNFLHEEKSSIDTGLFFREAILPKAGESSAPRLRALGKDFHPLCFKCQVIGGRGGLLSESESVKV